ncbi:hypothetical protein quinque_013984 [Culex quinquefasciatus]
MAYNQADLQAGNKSSGKHGISIDERRILLKCSHNHCEQNKQKRARSCAKLFRVQLDAVNARLLLDQSKC